MKFSSGGPDQWDQGINSLGGALFPDPSKVAQGYYYGSEARKAQLEGNALIRKENALAHIIQGAYGAPMAPPTFIQPGQTGAAPILGPPQGMPIGNPTLSSAVVPGPTGGAIVPQTMSPDQVAAQTPALAQPYTVGTPAGPASPAPGAGAPPAPTNTGSNGSQPAAQPGYGTIHYHSLNQTPGQGGTVFASPAGNNGSPANPIVDLPKYLAMGAAAGLDAAQTGLQGQGYLASLQARNLITPQQYNRFLSGTGQAQPYVADINAASALATAELQRKTELDKQAMVTGENRRQFDYSLERTVDPNTGQVTFTPRLKAAGMPAFDPQVASQQIVTNENARQFNLKPQPTLDATGKPVYTTQQEAPGKPVYEPQVAQVQQTQEGAFGWYKDPNNISAPGQIITAKEARERGWVPSAAHTEAETAQLTQQFRLETDPAKKQAILQTLQRLAAVPKAPDEKQHFMQQQLDYRQDQQVYTQPQRGRVTLGVTEPAAYDFNAQIALDDKIAELQASGERRYQNRINARAEAIRILQTEGDGKGMRLPTAQEVAAQRERTRTRFKTGGFAGDERLDQYWAPGEKGPTDHMMIRLVPMDYKAGQQTQGSTTQEPAATTGGRSPRLGQPLPPSPEDLLRKAEQEAGRPATTNRQIRQPPLSTTIPDEAGAPAEPYRGPKYGPRPGPPPNPAQRLATLNQRRTAAGQEALSPTDVGAIRPSDPGTPDGTTGYDQESGQRVVSYGGWAWPVR